MRQAMRITVVTLFLLAAATAAGGCTSASIQDDLSEATEVTLAGVWMDVSSFSDLVSLTDLAVVGVVASEGELTSYSPEKSAPPADLRVYDFKIRDVIVGQSDLNGGTISIAILDGFEGSTAWKSGEELVVFLTEATPTWMPIQADAAVYQLGANQRLIGMSERSPEVETLAELRDRTRDLLGTP